MPPKKKTKSTTESKVESKKKGDSVVAEEVVTKRTTRKRAVVEVEKEEEKPVRKAKEPKAEAKASSTKTSKTKKATASKGKEVKKAKKDEDEEIEAEPSTSADVEKPARKRGAAANKKEAVEAKKTKETKEKPAPSGATNWDQIVFSCDKKNTANKAYNTHITSWNVAGLRAWVKKGGLKILEHDDPDVLCLQETKCTVEQLPEEVKELSNYKAYWCCSQKAGYAGVGILSKKMPIDVTYGIGVEEHDTQGRCITAEYKQFYLVNVYVPNAGRKLVTLPQRLEWNSAFKDFVKKLDEKKPVIICGDMNVSHNEIDLANPQSNKKNAGFTEEEREGMTDFLKDGYADTFRELYPDRKDAYTFWTHLSNARARNVGWRLDYFIASKRVVENICDNVIYDKVMGSDHCPITLYFNM